MALFSKKEDKQKEEVVAKETTKDVATKTSIAKTSQKAGNGFDIAGVLRHPRITEKATLKTDTGVYVFDVAPKANKKEIKEAIYSVYKVTPVKVNITKVYKKKVRNPRTGIVGVKSGGKKVYVYLKKGDSISIM